MLKNNSNNRSRTSLSSSSWIWSRTFLAIVGASLVAMCGAVVPNHIIQNGGSDQQIKEKRHIETAHSPENTTYNNTSSEDDNSVSDVASQTADPIHLLQSATRAINDESAIHYKTVITVCPLVCKCDALLRHIDCSNASLSHVPQQIPQTAQSLSLKNNQIAIIEPSAFINLDRLLHLDVSGNALEHVSPAAAANVPNLISINLHSNWLNDSIFEALANASGLEEAILTNNSIASLSCAALGNNSLISSLSIDYNELTNVPADLFSCLPHLTTFNADHNRIAKLSHLLGVLEELPSARNETINVSSRNETTNVTHSEEEEEEEEEEEDTEMLYQMVYVSQYAKHLNLSVFSVASNNISSIDRDYFSAFPNLVNLDMHNNAIEAIGNLGIDGLGNLTHLRVDRNPFVTLENDLFSQCTSLLMLNVSNMPNLSYLNSNSFRGLSKLGVLDLANCHALFHIHAEAFAELTNLQHLNLTSANISLNHNIFDALNETCSVDLTGVPIQCDCDTAWMKAWLLNIVHWNQTVQNLKCSSPDEYRDILVKQVVVEHFSCQSPNITYLTVEGTMEIGTSAVINCIEDGQPASTITWITTRGEKLTYHPAFVDLVDATPFDDQFHSIHHWHDSRNYVHLLPQRFHILRNGSLYIDYVTREDGGIFTCIAKNDLGNVTSQLAIKLNYDIMLESTVWSMIIGLCSAICFLILGFTIGMIRHLAHWCSPKEREKRHRIKELLQTIQEYKCEKFDTLRAFKDAKLDKIFAFKNHKIDKLRTYKQATVTSIIEHMHNLRENYQGQMGSLKDNYSSQVDKLRENYGTQIGKLKDYKSDKIERIRDNYQNQAIKVRDYGSSQMSRLRDQYKLQQQHLLKLLELLDVGNCMSVIEAECMRTESMIFDPNITFDLEAQPVHPPKLYLQSGEESDYVTAGSQTDVSSSIPSETGISSRRGLLNKQHKRSTSDTSSSSDHSNGMASHCTMGLQTETLPMNKMSRKTRKKRKKPHSTSKHDAQLHNTHFSQEYEEDSDDESYAPETSCRSSSVRKATKGNQRVQTQPPSTLNIGVPEDAEQPQREGTPGEESVVSESTSADYESAQQSREHSPDVDYASYNGAAVRPPDESDAQASKASSESLFFHP